MLVKSLFGELTASPLPASRPLDAFAATAILESTDTRIADDGRMVDRHRLDLFVTGSPAQAIHEHLAQTQAGADARTITMLDPTRIWAPGVIKALADAT